MTPPEAQPERYEPGGGFMAAVRALIGTPYRIGGPPAGDHDEANPPLAAEALDEFEDHDVLVFSPSYFHGAWVEEEAEHMGRLAELGDHLSPLEAARQMIGEP